MKQRKNGEFEECSSKLCQPEDWKNIVTLEFYTEQKYSSKVKHKTILLYVKKILENLLPKHLHYKEY